MEKALEKLTRMDLSEENQKRLAELLVQSKTTGKVSSKKLIEVLDAVDATEAQTETYSQEVQYIYHKVEEITLPII